MNKDELKEIYRNEPCNTTPFSYNYWLSEVLKYEVMDNVIVHNEVLLQILDKNTSLVEIWQKGYREMWLDDNCYRRLLKESPFLYRDYGYFKGIALTRLLENRKYPYRFFKKDGLYYVIDLEQQGLLELEISYNSDVNEAVIVKCLVLDKNCKLSDVLDFLIWYLQKQNYRVLFALEASANTDVIAHIEWEKSCNWHRVSMRSRDLVDNPVDFERKISEIKIMKTRPKLLIHSCCGPCSSYVLEQLNPYFAITIYYYNPNIDTVSEYEKRLATQKEIIAKMGLEVELIAPEYEHTTYLQRIVGLERSKEGGTRCNVCFEYRLAESARYAKENGYDFFTTTLSISPHKNSEKINQIGQMLAEKFKISFLYSNFKLKGGYLRSIELSKQYDLYRQDYCGCEFSKNPLEKEERQTIIVVK